MKRYLLTSATLLVFASLYATWRMNCVSGCEFERLAFGSPVFFQTPIAPESGDRPDFILVNLLVNLGWSGLGSLIGWMFFDTFARWQDRRRPQI